MKKYSNQDVHISIQVKIVALVLVSLILTTMAGLFFVVTTQKTVFYLLRIIPSI